MNIIKILVACHKQASVPSDEVYTPIHVGRALHPEVELGFIGDDTGDNISKKNAAYCELTAQYWGWKNLKCDYIGLAHYRRFFEERFTNQNVEQLMEGCDIVLVSPIHFDCSVDHFWMIKLIPEDVVIFYLILQRYYPQEYIFAQQYFTGNLFYPCNMFVCRKQLFDEYATWQFDVLSKVEQIIPISGYSRERRIMGYLAEAMLPIWFFSHGYKVKTMPIVDQIGKQAVPHFKTRIKHIFQKWLIDYKYHRHAPSLLDIGDDYLGGLRQDGIIQKIDNLEANPKKLDNCEHHILCLGNSITHHPIKEEIGWRSSHGMAASCPEKDFCHLLEKKIQQKNPFSSITGVNIAEWETNFRIPLNSLIGGLVEGKDIIIIRLGENVRDTKHFYLALCHLINYCKSHVKRVVLCGCVWKNNLKELSIIKAARKCGVEYVPLDWIMSQHPETYPKVGDLMYDTNGNTYEIETPFITTHPNDLGMKMIADAIYNILLQ